MSSLAAEKITLTKEKIMPDYIPSKEADMLLWAQNFVAVATANLTALGLTSSDLNTISGGIDDANANLEAMTSLKAQFEAQVTDKDGTIHTMESSARSLVKGIQARPGVSDTLKSLLRINVSSGTRSRTQPVQPTALAAVPNADGTNALKWNKAGNKATTQFAVLAKPITSLAAADTDTDWAIVGLTTATRFMHQGVTPGAPMAYKVMAARAGFTSAASLPATVYMG